MNHGEDAQIVQQHVEETPSLQILTAQITYIMLVLLVSSLTNLIVLEGNTLCASGVTDPK